MNRKALLDTVLLYTEGYQQLFYRGRHAIDRFGQLLSSSPQGERALYLLKNPSIASRLITAGQEYCANCSGTASNVCGIDNLIKEHYLAQGYELGDFEIPDGDFVLLPDDGTPGYIGRKPFVSFLGQSPIVTEETEPSPGSIVGFWRNRGKFFNGPYGIQHSGVCLGDEDGSAVFFQKLSRFGDFAIGFLDHYITFLDGTLKLFESGNPLKTRYFWVDNEKKGS